MLHGTDSLRGLAHIEQVKVIGPISSEHRSGMVSFQISGMAAAAVVEALNKKKNKDACSEERPLFHRQYWNHWG